MAGRNDLNVFAFLKTNRPNKVVLLNRLNYYRYFRFGKRCLMMIWEGPKFSVNCVHEILL